MAAFRSRIESWAQAAGLLATAWVVWATAIAPFLGSQHLIDRIAWGIWLVLCALAWSAVVAVALLFVVEHLNRDGAPATIRISARR